MVNPQKTALALSVSAALLSTGVGAQATLEEIVVVAQKREQNLQDVPVSVTAFSGAQLKEAAVKDIFDIEANTPSLRVTQGTDNSTASFAIRGVGTSSFNSGLESSVGLYVDGVYRSRQSALIGDIVDIESIEVLRGPQGTLFGKNTPSGAILFRSKAPSHEQDGFVTVSAGKDSLLNGSAAANVSLIEDVLAVRGTVFSSSQDGSVDVSNLGEKANDRDRWGGRLQALWTPNEDLSVRLITDYSEINEVCCAAIQRLGNLTALNGDSSVVGSDAILAALGGTITQGDATGSRTTQANFLPQSSSEDGGVSLDVSWDYSDAISFSSITAYRDYQSKASTDNDFTDVDLLRGTEALDLSTFSQEFRVNYSGDKLNLVSGLYYFDQEIESRKQTIAGEQLDTFIALGAGIDALRSGIDTVSALSGGAIPLSSSAFLPITANNDSLQNQKSWAVFSQAEYHFNENWFLTLGLRYTHEEKDLKTIFSEEYQGADFIQPVQADIAAATVALNEIALGNFAVLADPIVGANLAAFSQAGWGHSLFTGLAERPDLAVRIEDEQLTGNIKLSTILSDNTLAYISYGTGYKSGGTNTDRIQLGQSALFGAETPESYEIGFKSEFPEQAIRLNTAAYYTTVDDFQANAFTGTSFVLSNAGELETYGVEAEFFWQASEASSLSISFAHNIAEYKEFLQGTCRTATPFHTGEADPATNASPLSGCDRSGDRLATTPKNLVNVAYKYDMSFGDQIDAYVFAEYAWRSDQILGDDADPLKYQDSFGLLNLRAGVALLDADIDITLWARNVLDEDTIGVTFDTPLQDGKLTAIPGPERSFGVTLSKNF